MTGRSRGRGLAAALGLFLLMAGLIAGGVLYVFAGQRPGRAVDGFARAPIGCTTTLEFSETGTFYLYEEAGSTVDPAVTGCEPFVSVGREFEAQFVGELRPASTAPDTSVTYDVDGVEGRSIARFEITEPGQYTVAVLGDDPTVAAALGRDPADGVDDLRRTALYVAIGGVALGLLLLTLSGHRSKRAAETSTPDGPGWGPARRPDLLWPPEVPNLEQRPVNPHSPSPPVAGGSWAPPSPETAPQMPAPDGPVLPDSPGKLSGT